MRRHYPDEGELPPHGTYVLVYFPDRPWHDQQSSGPELHKYRVVRFQRGISLAERDQMTDDLKRKKEWRPQDERSNNHRPYNWAEFGPGSFFGQECKFWYYLPDPTMET